MKRIATTVVVFGMGLLGALAQGGPDGPGGPGGPGGMDGPRHGGPGHRPPPPVIRALDTNTNGVIEASEIAAAATALKSLDKNGDGKLSADELRPAFHGRGERARQAPPDGNDNPPERMGRPPVDPVTGALDADGDGILSAEEIAGASAALKTLDKNGDGQLTREELRPPPPEDFDGNPPPDAP